MAYDSTIKKVVILGGGTGLSTLVRGLKKHPIDITAVVTVADDGGSSGRLLNEYDIPPPGDVRNVMAALSDVEPLVEKMFQYRFASSKSLEGHSLGNLMLAALTNITGDFARAVEQMSNILKIKGKVLPAANERITLKAELEDGTIVIGESNIPTHGKRIHRVYLSPEDVRPLPETIEAILQADLVVIGPGSLYTSILPAILVQDIREAVLKTAAKKVYLCNLTTQEGETDHYTASEHVQALYDHAGLPFIDAILLNSTDYLSIIGEDIRGPVPEPVEHDELALKKLVPHIVRQDIAMVRDGFILHRADKVATWLVNFMKHDDIVVKEGE